MALLLSRRFCCALLRAGRGTHPAVVVQAAGMKLVYGGKYPYKDPYDYKNKPFTFIEEWIGGDDSIGRLNENSKIITIEGPPASGKNEFAKKVAKEFDLHYMPTLKDHTVFTHPITGWDYRSINDCLGETAKFYDLEDFYNESEPTRGRVGRLQLKMYRHKYLQYAEALEHLLSTGQGVVVAGSAHADLAYTEAMRACGYVSKEFVNYYSMYYRDSICELWAPHLTVYLDMPVDRVMERVAQRGDPREKEGAVFNRNYVAALQHAYQQKYLPLARQKGHVLEIDLTQPLDDVEFDAITYEMSKLRMDSEDNEDPYFQMWEPTHPDKLNDDQIAIHRRVFGNRHKLAVTWLNRALPLDCDEIKITQEDSKTLNRFFAHHPGHKYLPGTAPELGNSTWFNGLGGKDYLWRKYLELKGPIGFF